MSLKDLHKYYNGLSAYENLKRHRDLVDNVIESKGLSQLRKPTTSEKSNIKNSERWGSFICSWLMNQFSRVTKPC